MSLSELDRLIELLARLPGLGPRSARRAVLDLIKRRESALNPLIDALTRVSETVTACGLCGNLDVTDPCRICTDPQRDPQRLCVIEDVADLWAMERTAAFSGRYHVLGGLLSALDGIGPDDLRLPQLAARATDGSVEEVILALPATVDGQTTAHTIAAYLKDSAVAITGLAQGVPIGGELDYLDDGTITQALRARRPV